MANAVYDFIKGMSVKEMLAYSRVAYRALNECHEFRYQDGREPRADGMENTCNLHLGKEADVEDRFLFLYFVWHLYSYLTEAQIAYGGVDGIYFVRNVGTTFVASEKATNGVTMIPCSLWVDKDGRNTFPDVWLAFPEDIKEVYKKVWQDLPKNISEEMGKPCSPLTNTAA